MALPPPLTYRQDLPPVGGFPKPTNFPVAGFRKRSPARGPAGVVLVAGAVGLTLFGWYRLLDDIEERNYYNLSRFNQRFERGYVLQAKEDASWMRRHKEYLDRERALMKDVPGWVVHRNRFYTQFEQKPDIDTLDPRFSLLSHW